MKQVNRCTVVTPVALAPMTLPAHHREGHSKGPRTPDPSPVDPELVDPGPAGDLTWKGFHWLRRDWAGGPQYNRMWSPDNVMLAADGSITLRMSNPGVDPVGAELVSTRTGWGYGTYRCTVEASFDSVGPSLVWGCMFTYDSEQVYPEGHNELDSGEISAWGVNGRIPRLIGGYWADGPTNVVSHDVELPGGLRHFVFEMVWEPGAVTYRTLAGTTAADEGIASSCIQGTDVPVPATERVHLNIWVTALGDSDSAGTPSHSARLTDFAFTPA